MWKVLDTMDDSYPSSNSLVLAPWTSYLASIVFIIIIIFKAQAFRSVLAQLSFHFFLGLTTSLLPLYIQRYN
jgi:hypothetical protein